MAPKAAPEGAPATLPPGAQRFMLAQPATLSERIIGRWPHALQSGWGAEPPPDPRAAGPGEAFPAQGCSLSPCPHPPQLLQLLPLGAPAAPGDQQEGRRGPRVGQCGALTTPRQPAGSAISPAFPPFPGGTQMWAHPPPVHPRSRPGGDTHLLRAELPSEAQDAGGHSI